MSKLILDFTRFRLWLGHVPAVAYILLYVVLIFLFAGIYWSLPRFSFYHSTSGYESEFLNPSAEGLRSELSKALRTMAHANLAKTNGWQVDESNLLVTALDVRDYPLQFKLRVVIPLEFDDSNGRRIAQSIKRPTLTLMNEDRFYTSDSMSLMTEIDNNAIVSIEGIADPPKPSYLLLGTEQAEGQFTMSMDLYNRLVEFGQANRGFPDRVSGHFLRMLYFSAGVSTSSAMGDIAPVAMVARLWVVIQSLSSIIVLGLFLNSLAEAISNRNNMASIVSAKTDGDEKV